VKRFIIIKNTEIFLPQICSFSGEFTTIYNSLTRDARVRHLSLWTRLGKLAKSSSSACTDILQHATAWVEWHCVPNPKYCRAKTS